LEVGPPPPRRAVALVRSLHHAGAAAWSLSTNGHGRFPVIRYNLRIPSSSLFRRPTSAARSVIQIIVDCASAGSESAYSMECCKIAKALSANTLLLHVIWCESRPRLRFTGWGAPAVGRNAGHYGLQPVSGAACVEMSCSGVWEEQRRAVQCPLRLFNPARLVPVRGVAQLRYRLVHRLSRPQTSRFAISFPIPQIPMSHSSVSPSERVFRWPSGRPASAGLRYWCITVCARKPLLSVYVCTTRPPCL
jgi:hypothetical protein